MSFERKILPPNLGGCEQIPDGATCFGIKCDDCAGNNLRVYIDELHAELDRLTAAAKMVEQMESELRELDRWLNSDSPEVTDYKSHYRKAYRYIMDMLARLGIIFYADSLDTPALARAELAEKLGV